MESGYPENLCRHKGAKKVKKKFYIGDICVGDEKQALVIPEIGINHEGSLTVAKEMVTAAYRAGARLIKHQTHVVEDEMCRVAKNVIPGNSSDSILTLWPGVRWMKGKKES